MVTVPWWFLGVSGHQGQRTDQLDGPAACAFRSGAGRCEWLAADRFTVADLLIADVLRVKKMRAHGERPASEAYVARVTARPAFLKAHADQVAHFAAADQKRTPADPVPWCDPA